MGFWVGIAAAQTPLVTDRPDQTESSEVIPKGAWQLETGWTFTEDDGTGSHELPGTLIRVGISPRWELRFGWDGYVSGPIDIVADGQLGAKVVLAEGRAGKGARPQIALLMSTSVPVGDARFTSDEFDPSFRLLVAHELASFDLAYNIGMAWESEILLGGRQSTLSRLEYTVAVGFEVTDSVGAFVELFGDQPTSGTGQNSTSFDSGLTFELAERLQLDVAAGVGLTDVAADWFVGIGVSARWPH